MAISSGFPDLIVCARRCHTHLPNAGRAEAAAVAGGRVLYVGSRRAVLRARRRRTRVIELGMGAITPGLVDCHTHFFYWALARALVIDLSACYSLDAVLNRLHGEAKSKRIGDWVLAQGFDHNRWGDAYPGARDLDAVVGDRPAMVRSRDGHTVWLSTAAMRRIGLRPGTPDPPGGRYLRDAHGRPMGIAQEAAVDALSDPLREFALRTDPTAHRVIDRALRAAYVEAWSQGYVGVHTMDDGPSLTHLQRHHADGRLGLRVVHALARRDFPAAQQLGLRSGLGDDWLRIGGLKLFADGALGSQTAYMHSAYPHRGKYSGVPVLVGEPLKELLVDAVRAGWACWIHAIGDRAVASVLDAFAAARRVGSPPLPHRIEHVQCIRPADVRRMAQLGVIASVQPCHVLGDIVTADRHWPRARRNAYPFRRLLDAGVTLAAGSDVPIEALDVRRSLFGAAARTDEHGQPAGGWFPDQRITVAEALAAHTTGAAAAWGGSSTAGVIAPGAPADLTLWAEDPLRVPPTSLLNLELRGCVVGGTVHLT